MRALRWGAAAVIALTVACHKPTADEHFGKGNAFFDQEKWAEAILEYKSALQVDPKRGDIYTKLADAQMKTGDIRGVIGSTIRAADALPNDAKAQVRAGSMLLVARAFEDARARAEKALAIDPKNGDALILRGNAMAGLKNLDKALEDYQRALVLEPNQEVAYANIGVIESVKGQTKEAEASFRKAVDVSPKSVTARMALANFFWATGRLPEAEQTLKDALVLSPTDAVANRALAVFYVGSKRMKEAEPYFIALAKNDKSPAASVSLADYYALSQRFDEARKVLTELGTTDAGYAIANTRLAALDSSQGQRGKALERLHDVIAKKPKDMTARLLNARLLLEDGKNDQALTEANAIVKDDPNSESAGEAFLVIGRVNAMTDHVEEAVKAYEEALKYRSQPRTAALALAALHLSSNHPDKAETYVNQALTAAPADPLARAMRIRVMLAKGETAKAKTEIDALEKDFPRSPTVMNLIAGQQLASKQLEAARATYAKVAAAVPSDLEAMIGLTQIDLMTGHAKDAAARVEAGLKTNASSSELLTLAARTIAVEGNFARAEELLKMAIERYPSHLAAYGLLGQLYASRNRLEDAATQFRELTQRNPKSVSGATMLGMIYEAQKRGADAEKQYQAALAIDKNSAVAANNLAWVWVDSNRNLDEALQLALTADRLLPEEPHVKDTLGWIYFRKGMANEAVKALEASAKIDSTDPSTQYHLGKAYVLWGDLDKAKLHLKRAVDAGRTFDGIEDAKAVLAQLGGKLA